jgi:hypothetical protein
MQYASNPMTGLKGLQAALTSARISKKDMTTTCKANNIFSTTDSNGDRITYAIIRSGKVHAYVAYGRAEDYQGDSCWGIFYSSIESKRRKGLVSMMIRKSLEDMKKKGAKYVEAIVDVDNEASMATADKFFKKVKDGTDGLTSEPIYQYLLKL